MKRYFIVPPGKLPHECDCPVVGVYHYIDLDSHEGFSAPEGYGGSQIERELSHDFPSLEDWTTPVQAIRGARALVQMDGDRPAHDDWEELPHLLDARTALGHPKHQKHLQLLQHLKCRVVDDKGRPTLDDSGNEVIVNPSAEHGGYELAKLLQSIIPLFEP